MGTGVSNVAWFLWLLCKPWLILIEDVSTTHFLGFCVAFDNYDHSFKARSDLRDSRCVIRMWILHASQGLSLSWLALRKTQLIGIFLILRFTHRKYLPWFAMRITPCDSRTSVQAYIQPFHRYQCLCSAAQTSTTKSTSWRYSLLSFSPLSHLKTRTDLRDCVRFSDANYA